MDGAFFVIGRLLMAIGIGVVLVVFRKRIGLPPWAWVLSLLGVAVGIVIPGLLFSVVIIAAIVVGVVSLSKRGQKGGETDDHGRAGQQATARPPVASPPPRVAAPPTASAPRSPNTCPSCGAAITPGATFCKGCGARLEAPEPAQPVCPSCGAAVTPGAKFCKGCGAALQ